MGEFNDLKSRINDSDELGRRLSEQVSEIDTIQDKLRSMEKLKQAGAEDSLGDAAISLMSDLDSKMEKMQSEINDLKVVVLWYSKYIICSYIKVYIF